MLDVHFIRENVDRVKANCKNRNVSADVDAVLAIDDRRKQFASRRQTIQQRQNELSKLIPAEKDKEKKQVLVAEAKQLREQVGELEKQEKQVEEELRKALLVIPNMTHPAAPVGQTADDNQEVGKWGEPRQFDFKVKDHVALAEALDLVDFEAGAAVAGQK